MWERLSTNAVPSASDSVTDLPHARRRRARTRRLTSGRGATGAHSWATTTMHEFAHHIAGLVAIGVSILATPLAVLLMDRISRRRFIYRDAVCGNPHGQQNTAETTSRVGDRASMRTGPAGAAGPSSSETEMTAATHHSPGANPAGGSRSVQDLDSTDSKPASGRSTEQVSDSTEERPERLGSILSSTSSSTKPVNRFRLKAQTVSPRGSGQSEGPEDEAGTEAQVVSAEIRAPNSASKRIHVGLDVSVSAAQPVGTGGGTQAVSPRGGGAHSESPRLPSGEASAGEAASEAQVAAASAETDPSLSRAPPTSAPKRFHVGVASAVQPVGTGGRATLPPLSPPVTRAVGSLSAGGPAIAVVI